jgi:hypothetical protein
VNVHAVCVIVKLFITNLTVLRKILGPELGVVTRGWGILREWEIHNVFLVDIFRMVISSRIVCVEHITCTGQKRNSWKVFVGRFEVKTSF